VQFSGVFVWMWMWMSFRHLCLDHPPQYSILGHPLLQPIRKAAGAQEKTATTPRMRYSLVSTTMERSSPPMIAEGMGTSAVLGLHSPVARHRRRYHITYPHSECGGARFAIRVAWQLYIRVFSSTCKAIVRLQKIYYTHGIGAYNQKYLRAK
jgi:hypothetical protein